MKYRINVGDALPQFKAQDQEGNTLITEDFLGTPVVFYFYPKDDTPGCTKEACSFRDNMKRLTAIRYRRRWHQPRQCSFASEVHRKVSVEFHPFDRRR